MKKVAASAMMFALIISAFNMPLVSVAQAQSLEDFSFSFPNFDFGLPDLSLGGLDMTSTSCDVTADNTSVFTGGSVNLTWNTSGFDTVTINGQAMNATDGTIQMSNILANTVYTLSAATVDGAGHCTATVQVTCVPPPVDCRLEVTKVVDKTVAAIGDTLVYTITVKNVGTTDCSGAGVKIEDILSDKLTYLTQTNSSNTTPGYDGGIPVYTSGNRTIHFNGNILNPGETGSMTVSAKVNTPTSCGDFEISNQAKATAKELNNFGTWAYSPVVKTSIHNGCVDPAPSCDSFIATPASIIMGGNATLTWQTSNDSRVVINNGVGEVAADGSVAVAPITSTTYVLTAFGTQNRTVNCSVPVTVSSDSAPSCDSFIATPATITVGGSSVLAWQTSNASVVTMNNGIGNVAADGSVTVSPTTNTTYQLTVMGTQNRTVNCSIPVTVTTHQVPVCEFFTATPGTLPVGGGQTTLNWKVNNATNVSISPTLGTVAAQGSQATNVTANTNFVLTATDADGHQVTCAAPVVVPPPTSTLSCQNNVSFTASDYSITRGNDSVLTWNASGIDTVSISTIGATTLSGSRSVEPTSDTTYVLTAKKGTASVDCPLTVSVSSGGGGGGGGSSAPRCDLSISDNSIRSGEQVTLKWSSRYGTDVTLIDNRDNELVNTLNYASKDKKEHFNGSLSLRPMRDTDYTLTVKRGSKERVCKVKVNVDDLTVITDRKPTVAGISLVNVPYTGFEAGPMLTIIFYVLLTAWALFVTYLIVIRRQPTLGNNGAMTADFPNAGFAAMKQAETVRPDVFASVAAAPVATIPANLPVAPVVGYANMTEVHNLVNSHQVTDEVVTALENRAHNQMALLSSDAIRHFISTTAGTVERNEALDAVIAEAKAKYPLEDNWIVINEARMQNLCQTCKVNPVASQAAPYVPALVPAGSSSLAEAIVTGNIVAAYEMIGNRPMFALADAATDLDAVVRSRRGEVVSISDLLKSETNKLSDEKLKNMITALTGALDGTYSDEASAVKVAIMKAVKETA